MKAAAITLFLLTACSAPHKSSVAPLNDHAQIKAPPIVSKDSGHVHAPPMSNMTSYWLVLLRKTDIAAELALTVEELNALTFMLTLSSVSSGTGEEATAGSTPRVAKFRLVR